MSTVRLEIRKIDDVLLQQKKNDLRKSRKPHLRWVLEMTSLETIQKRLDELSELERKAMRPWHIGHVDENDDTAEIEDSNARPVCSVFRREHEALICQSVNSLPHLIEAMRELVNQIEIYAGQEAEEALAQAAALLSNE